MTALFVSIAAASMASARDVDVTSPPTQDEGQAADTPNLIMTLDGNVTDQENGSDEPNLYQTQDSPLVDGDNSTLVIAPRDAEGAEDNNLIATQTTPDISVLVAGCLSLVVAAAAVSVLLLIRRRKTE